MVGVDDFRTRVAYQGFDGLGDGEKSDGVETVVGKVTEVDIGNAEDGRGCPSGISTPGDLRRMIGSGIA